MTWNCCRKIKKRAAWEKLDFDFWRFWRLEYKKLFSSGHKQLLQEMTSVRLDMIQGTPGQMGGNLSENSTCSAEPALKEPLF